jgi:hypothetical protein
MPKLQKKPSVLKSEHPALQKMKILSYFLFFGVIFPLLDPDPDPTAQINADPCGSGSRSETLVIKEENTTQQCCGPGMFIPDLIFSIPDPGSRVKMILDPSYASKNISIFNTKIQSWMFIPDPGSGS